MGCEEVRDILLSEGEHPAELQKHIAGCSACEAYSQQWNLLRSGLSALAKESAPEASLGFAARVARRLDREAGSQWTGAAFFEGVGRRFVYAGLLLALALLLAIAVPSSGPVRSHTSAEAYLVQPESVAAQNDSPFPVESGVDFSDLSGRPSHREAPGQK